MCKQIFYAVLIVQVLIGSDELFAQSEGNANGLIWVNGLSWEQIKQKAKVENKYIFIDAYTTWCGPCKMMDKSVYPNSTLGYFFKEHFIAVKIQMDVTDKDDQYIKDFYEDVKKMERDYAITAYPSLIFLSPDATILYKLEGYRSVQELIDTASLILTKGTIYNDPYKQFRSLITEYKNGVKHYHLMPYMIKTAIKLKQEDLVNELIVDHLKYSEMLDKTVRYSKENIELWASFDLGFTSKAFHFFYQDGDIIDQIMEQKGYAAGIIDNSIQSRVVDSFFRMQKGETTIVTGEKVLNSEIMFMRLPVRPDGKITPDYVEADWEKLKKMIRKYVEKDYLKRNFLTAKIRWYSKHQNLAAASAMTVMKLNKYPPSISTNLEASNINDIGWFTFLYVTDKRILRLALKWMKKAVQVKSNDDTVLDTYANLLYKCGRIQEAIRFQEKALSNTNPKDVGKKATYKTIIEKMRNGEPTYLEEGAIWK